MTKTQKSRDKEAGLIHSIYRIPLRNLFPHERDVIHKSFDEIKDSFGKIIGVVEEEQTSSEKELKNKKNRERSNKTSRRNENRGNDDNNDNLYRSYEIREDKGIFMGAILYVKCSNANIEEFADFYSPLVSDKVTLNGFFEKNEPKYLSAILLLRISEENLYAVTSGYARYSIQSIIEKDFGLKVLSHEIEHMKISGRTLNPIEGTVQAEHEVYNQLVHINNIQTYTGIIGKISGRLAQSEMVQKLCGRDLHDSVAVNAKDSIRIGGKATFANLCRFLKCVDETVKGEAAADKINSIQRIEKKKAEGIWEEIYQKLVNTETGEETERNGEEIYIFPEKDAEVYLSANSYKLSSRGNEDGRHLSEKPLLLKDITSWDGKVDENQMKQFIENEKIQFITEALDDVYKKIPLKSCLNGYVRGKGDKTYILRYGELYQYSKKAIEALREKIDVYLEDIWMNREELVIPEKFDVEVEKKENKKRSKDDKKSTKAVPEEAVLHKMCEFGENSYLFHKCYAQGTRIEIADIIKKMSGKYYFIHVKRRFDGNMRVLQKQIEISIYNLMRYMRAGEKEKNDFFNSYCKEQKQIREKENKGKRKKAKIVKRNFFKDIKIGNIEYVACLIVRTKTEGQSLREYITKSDSFPALLCLDELHKYCFKMEVKLHLFLLFFNSEKEEKRKWKWKLYSAGGLDDTLKTIKK